MYLTFIVGLLLAPQADEQKRFNTQVTEFAKRFYLAYENGEVDTLAGMVSIPWYHDGQAIVRMQDGVRIELKKLIDQRDAGTGKRVPDVKLVATYAQMKERMPAKDRELLEQVVRDDDYLALVMLKPADPKNRNTQNVVLFVRAQDGKLNAIGFKHTQ